MKLSLSRKPDAVAWSIEDLLAKVREGHIRLPEFQRLYAWDAGDVVQLFDSIVRGFPIGTFLFWSRPAASEGRPLDFEHALAASVTSNLLFVLDGQQRMTSLAGVLLAAAEPQDERFRVAFALDADELTSIPASEAWPERAVPLFHALDSVNLQTWAIAHGLDQASLRRALEIGRAIREYRVPAYIVVAETDETARLIYDRVNSSGKKLTKADIFKALHEGFGSQHPNTLEGLERSIVDLRFGPLRDNLYLQAAAAVAGLDVTKIDHAALSKPALGTALPNTAPALRQAIAFLRNDAQIPTSALLPYGFPVVALTRFFHFHPSPQPRSRELLARWVWRGALSNKHWTHEQAYLRETLRAIQGPDEEGEVQAMLALLPQRAVAPELSEYNLKAAQTRLHLLALLELRPRDLLSGEPLDAAALVADEGSAAVQPLASEPSGDAAEDEARATIFGRIIQKPTTHSRLLASLSGLHADDTVLASLGLTRAEADAARANKPFALGRQRRLTRTIEDFFNGRAKWGDSDRPSLKSMLVEDAS